MTEELKLSIPDPCHERWELMQEHDKARLCKTCSRRIIDFTTYSDGELIHFLSQNDGKICGRFRKTQLNRPLLNPQQPVQAKRNYVLSGILALSLTLPFEVVANH